jgi:hypothetical protein
LVAQIKNKKLAVAVAAFNRRIKPRGHGQTQSAQASRRRCSTMAYMAVVLHDAALAHLARLQLELRLDQGQQRAARFQERHNRRQHQGLRDEGQVAHHHVKLRHKRLFAMDFRVK